MIRIRHMRHRWLTAMILFLSSIHPFAHSFAQHYIGAAVGGHMPMCTDNIAATHSKPAFGGEVGAVYEWRNDHFLVQTGLHYALLCSKLTIDDTQLEQEMLDTRGIRFLYQGDLAKRTDQLLVGQIGVPLFVGGTWQGIYFLTGLRLTVNLHAKATQKAQLQTIGDYMGRYYDPLENMPNHGYHAYEPVRTSQTVSLKPIDVRIGAEVGYTLELPSGRPGTIALPPLLRIGAFVEYGLFNICSNAAKSDVPASVEPDYTHYMSVTMNHIYTSSDAAKNAAHWLTCGIRVTFLYPISAGKRGCNCY